MRLLKDCQPAKQDYSSVFQSTGNDSTLEAMGQRRLCIDLWAAMRPPRPNLDLESRMVTHIISDPDSESLDSEELKNLFGSEKKADFLVGSRTGIIELKTFNADPSDRLEKIMKRRMAKPGAPYVMGEVGLDFVLRGLDDGEQLSKQIVDSSARAARRHLKSANLQIGSTKRVLGLDASKGSLVLLNDSQPLIDASTITYAIREALESDSDQFQNIDFVLILVEAHLIKVESAQFGYPMVAVFWSDADDAYLDMMARMVESWCYWHHGKVVPIQHNGDWNAMAPVFPTGNPRLSFY
jgi:hypothetical protein